MKATSADAAGAVRNAPAERVLGREGDGVQHAVQRTPPVAQRRGDRGDLLGLVDVELEDVGWVGQALGDALGDAHATAETGEDDLGPLTLRALGDGEGDRLLGEDAGDEQALAVEEHRESVGLRRAAGH